MTENLCWINVGPAGRFRSSGSIFSTPADIDRLTGPLMEGHTRLLLHFHGGLVSETSGKAIAEAMAAHYGRDARSIGLVWETGLLEVFGDNLRKVSNTRVFRKALSWIIAKAMARLGGDEGARGFSEAAVDPLAIEAALQSEGSVIALDAALCEAADATSSETCAKAAVGEEDQVEAIALDLELDFTTDTSLIELIQSGNPEAATIRDQLPAEEGAKDLSVGAIALFIAKVIAAVLRRYRTGTHHDPLPTAVEELLRAAYLGEIGVFAWDRMKRKALDMWKDDGASPGDDGHVGGYLLRRLEKLQKDREEVTIDLVGHSAGSIAICHMLEQIEAQRRAIRIRNVAFLAPAVRLDLFASRIARSQPQFQRFRSFTMSDNSEKADKLVGALYPRSLLFFISGLLEDRPGVPLAGLARHLLSATAAAGPGYDEVRRWLAAQNRLVIAPTEDGAAPGLRARSGRHGDFDNDDQILSSLLHMARLEP